MSQSAKLSPSAMKARLAAFRNELIRMKLDGFIVPRQDEFQGEYVAAYAERLKWICGFSGSWGSAVVGRRSAAIFVDGRYTVQVKQQVDLKVFSYQHLLRSPPAEWIASNFSKGARIGYDPRILAIADARRYRKVLEKAGIAMVPASYNPVDKLWADQPERPAGPVVAQPLRFTGATSAQKLSAIRKELKAKGADAVLLADPTSVAWAFNMRGNDVPHTPVALTYALIPTSGKAQIFIAAKRLSQELAKTMRSLATCDTDVDGALKALGKRKARVMLDSVTAPDHARLLVEKSGGKIVDGIDPCLFPKAIKSKAEQQGARDAQVRDGAALSNFLCWLERAAASGKITEGAAARHLLAERQKLKGFRDLSFETISAAGPHSALPHYHAHGEGTILKKDSIYLIDSGGQFPDGTTDVTRTVIVGKPSADMRDRFTRVLKGMIAISAIRFPEGTTGAHLDVLARAALWKAGLDFDHGTGHGIGAYLSVHEGPQRISKTAQTVLQPGMIISNEPGYYKEGHYGIRIENLLLVSPPDKRKSDDRAMLGFETLTFAPIDRRLIETQLLTREELQWLDAYHADVWRKLNTLVSASTRNWLKRACASLN